MSGDLVVRFSVRQRLEHLAVMLLFIALAVTGFPQKFFDTGWALWVVDALGGIDVVRWLHRIAGIAFAALVVVHVTIAVTQALTGGAWSIVPARKDFTDAVQTLRYYLGVADAPARFDRFDYRQKFEYWGLVLGGVVMIVTGFILYFPVAAARLLPPELIPAAKVAHSNEGLLALLVVIIWHIYNAHLSPDVFPFDTAIFTGRISRHRLEHEHPRWGGRVVRVAAGVVDPASERFLSFLSSARGDERGRTELIDRRGIVIATTDPARRYVRPADGESDVLAVVPLSVVPWRLAIRAPEREALGSLAALWGRLVLMAGVVLGVGLVFAWGAARSIRGPLRVLNRAAERIAAGQMTEPIPPLPEDEVGRLGKALDRMRAALLESHRELERRVEERTGELERLYRELSVRDRSRAELLRKVISAQEDERRRVARELHDETSQSLAALAMSLDTALVSVPPGPARVRLEDARAVAGRALDEVHRLLFDLRPSVLDDLGLGSAVRWCAERHLEPLGIAVRCEFSGLEERLPSEIETALFRVVQEAVTNIAKHARAEAVLIQCALRDGRATVEIEDDGRGFDPDAPGRSPDGTGLGLAGMRERVTLLGGTLDIDSGPGDGTRIALCVPVPAEIAHA